MVLYGNISCLISFFYAKKFFQFILFGAEVAKAVDKAKNEVASVT
jgi:hypothetical protein